MSQKPNILFILTDQQSFSMMSCMGNPYVKTPAMDSIAATGIRFDRAYCSNPVCVPSRFSLLTGLMPSAIDVRSNVHDNEPVPAYIKENGIGFIMKKGGYEVAYGGKVHLPKLSVEDLGFNVISKDERDLLVKDCEIFLEQDRDKPFFLVASLINPHDICYMAIREHAVDEPQISILKRAKEELEELEMALELPEGITEESFFKSYCPPLPDNHQPQEDEPDAIKAIINQRLFKQNARDNFTEEQWRMHRWAYSQLTKRVDDQIGSIIDSLKKNHLYDNTVIIFTSDHGDLDASHKMEHKTALYDEAHHVPFIISCPNQLKQGVIDNEHLISNGLDLIPTICDFAGIPTPEYLQGKSIKPLCIENEKTDWRDHLQVESEFGKMVVTKDFKYVRYDEGKHNEQLYDIKNDPGEMKNSKDAFPDELKKHQDIYQQYFS